MQDCKLYWFTEFGFEKLLKKEPGKDCSKFAAISKTNWSIDP